MRRSVETGRDLTRKNIANLVCFGCHGVLQWMTDMVHLWLELNRKNLLLKKLKRNNQNMFKSIQTLNKSNHNLGAQYVNQLVLAILKTTYYWPT